MKRIKSNDSINLLLKRVELLAHKYDVSTGKTRQSWYIKELKKFNEMKRENKKKAMDKLIHTPKTETQSSKGLAVKKLPKGHNKLK